jgi:HEAT repeat protein
MASALGALGALGATAARPVMERLSRDDSSLKVRQAALQALQQLDASPAS